MQKILLVFILIILGLHTLGNVNGWYLTTNLDIPMHMMGGAWIALLFFYLFAERKTLFDVRRNKLASFILAAGFVALFGVLWEFHEYLVEVFISKRVEFGCMQPGALFDTLKDLFDDIFGGFVASAVYLFWNKQRSIQDGSGN